MGRSPPEFSVGWNAAITWSLTHLFKNDVVAALPELRAFSRFLCREHDAASDLVQNTVEAALDRQHQFEPGTNLKAWLFTIMRNRFYGDLRAQRRRVKLLEESHATQPAAITPGDGAAHRMDLSSALWKLGPKYREALVLVGAGGFSYEEAAQLCQCTVGTMKARVSRARRQLAAEFES